MIKPTPGRIVWYYPGEHDGLPRIGKDPLAAMIVGIHSDRLVNLTVFDITGGTHRKTSVVLVQEGDGAPESAYCAWMPYQVGQAKKHEAPCI